MSFRVKNVNLSEAVAVANANTQKKISELSYTPAFIFKGFDKEVTQGTFTINSINGYKTISATDANDINIQGWINTLKTILAGASHLGNIIVSIVSVDAQDGTASSISNLNVIVSGDNTFTLVGGDLITTTTFYEGQKVYMSYVTNN